MELRELKEKVLTAEDMARKNPSLVCGIFTDKDDLALEEVANRLCRVTTDSELHDMVMSLGADELRELVFCLL